MNVELLYTAAEMRAAEEAFEGETLELMERAGTATAEEILARYPDARSIWVWCGTGSNGGDGFVVARKLRDAGRNVRVRIVGDESKVSGDAEENLRRAREAGVPVDDEPVEPDVVVDALFGTGFKGKPRQEAVEAIRYINDYARVVAVDLPSGVDASTGEVAGTAVRAAMTVTFHEPKVGLVVAPGRFHAGEVVVADIGLPRLGAGLARVSSGILERVPRRRQDDNKYSAGSVLVVGGSTGKTGAACLAAEASLRAGAGICTVCAPASLNLVFEQRLLEVMTRPCPDEGGVMTMDAADIILDAAERAGAVALGPGLGRSDGTRALVGYLLDRLEKPIVLDADGLWALVGHLDWVFKRDAPTVLTPHEGELAPLLGRKSDWVRARRLHAVQAGADDVGAVVLLKGADTLVAAPGRQILVADLGNPGLATAGAGDVLTGITAAFLAKGMDPRAAAAAAAVAQGVAANLAAERHGYAGLLARDLVEALSPALSGRGPAS
jgi:ADP-dependent NAD(P)H-hydrate dehydratase / NAD(P)H-hydrate epimerase